MRTQSAAETSCEMLKTRNTTAAPSQARNVNRVWTYGWSSTAIFSAGVGARSASTHSRTGRAERNAATVMSGTTTAR